LLECPYLERLMLPERPMPNDTTQEPLNAKTLTEGPKLSPMEKGPQLKRAAAKKLQQKYTPKPRQYWLQVNGLSRIEAAFLNKPLYLNRLSKKHQQRDDPKNFLRMTPERQMIHATKIARDVQRLAPLLALRYVIAQQRQQPTQLQQVNDNNNINSVQGSINALTVNPALPTNQQNVNNLENLDYLNKPENAALFAGVNAQNEEKIENILNEDNKEEGIEKFEEIEHENEETFNLTEEEKEEISEHNQQKFNPQPKPGSSSKEEDPKETIKDEVTKHLEERGIKAEHNAVKAIINDKKEEYIKAAKGKAVKSIEKEVIKEVIEKIGMTAR